MRHLTFWSFSTAVTTALLFVWLASPSEAVLRHKYTFNDGTAADPVADVSGSGVEINATFVNQGNLGQIAGGYADLSNNNGLISGQDFVNGNGIGSYIEIPSIYDEVNNDYQLPFSDAAYNSPDGEASIEMWVTVDEQRDFARIWDMGRSAAGQGQSGLAFNGEYVYGVAQAGALQGYSIMAGTHSTAQTETNISPASPAVLSPGVEYHIAFTLDANDTSAGPNGTVKLYLDGSQVASGAIDNGNSGVDAIDITFLQELNSWFGRSQWGSDYLFDGLYNEIRIYSHELTPTEVMANYNAGPDDGSALPTVNIDRATGEITISNNNASSVNLVSLSLLSSAGALDTAEFQSIDGTWGNQALTATEITESGSTSIPGSTTNAANLGNTWIRSSIEDLQVVVELSDGTHTGAFVTYSGTSYSPIDLNTDGVISVEDYLDVFAPNGESDLSSETLVAAALKGDLDGDYDNDYDDWVLFKSLYNAANGPGALEQAIANYTAVPEPSTLWLIGLAGVVLWTRRPSAR
ncbi:LamG-like jellyroll fold domain-containing protein [Aeoliella mucimassa]|uniref:Ice-binding protein C-terminal domain-containing protein n=1 Tax=Aeoliella mucimassa TaxID=2527972 RepID=A0A518AW28_9BACT|nr:LamG-like jellyroll fold domain-containing protein [Aeoliella mucimassa]QDU58947.1 hypothetical protein Pan181_51880 [Aeoliella mucimassa]